MSSREDDSLPPYSYVPGGPWPHPVSSPQGHLFNQSHPPVKPIEGDAWQNSPAYLRGHRLFDAGYYWEAHESWEALWHAHGRKGPTAILLQALIKLAAAGVKIREGRTAGAITHASRAADLFDRALQDKGPCQLGLDLKECIAIARAIAKAPPVDRGPSGARVRRVFQFSLAPRIQNGPPANTESQLQNSPTFDPPTSRRL